MLSRSSISIRKLISPRRRSEDDDGGYVEFDDLLQSEPANMDVAKDPWLTKRRSYGRKRLPAPIIVSSPATIHDISRPLPPLPDETPRSSDSSLCSSCEHHADPNCPRLPGLRRSPLCSISSKEDRSEESLQLSSVTSYGADDSPPPPFPKPHVLSPIHTRQHEAQSSGSTLDFMGALSTQSEGKAKLSDGRASFQGFSENVQQLIQETDEAFKAVGSALAEAKSIRISFNETPPMPPTPDISPIMKSASRHQSQKPPSKLDTSPSPPRRNSSVSKVNRKKSKKTKAMKPQRKPAATKQAAKSGPRWTLSDNVSELLTGKIFHKIEADEMLTPSQLEAYRLRRMSHLQAQKSTDTLEDESADTPIEPFHLEDLPSRIGSAGVQFNRDTLVEDKPSAASFTDVVRQDFSLEGNIDGHPLGSFPPGTDADERPTLQKNSTYPTPPIKHTPRFNPRRQVTELPIIPETSTTPAADDELFMCKTPGRVQDSVANSDYVFLQSSPCTLTIPTFRHGPIRLAKTDLVPEPKLGADDGLDWTAFQMAILGGAGDWFSDSDDTIRREEAEAINDLADWWDTLNFDSPGGLITHEMEVSSPTSTTSSEDYSDVSYSEIENDNPYGAHHKWEEIRRKAAAEGRQLNFAMPPNARRGPAASSSYYAKGQIKRWTADSEEKQCVAAGRESYGSLPQSPMLDLRVIRSEEGDDLDVVPMGYNLGHDLGDFLKWEAEHAYAGDFYTESGLI